MVTKFIQAKKKSILICIVDRLSTYSTDMARSMSINITDFFVHRLSISNFDIFVSTDEDALLKEAAADPFYTHAVVISTGVFPGLSDRLFTAIENLCKKDFFIAGHILDREHYVLGNYYWELHHQIYAVNLKEFNELNCPDIGQASNEKHSQVKPLRSEECMYNDREIPLWMKHGTELFEYDGKLHGWNIIKVGLENNKLLIDIGDEIRNNKKYFYYEYDHVFLKELKDIYWNELFCNNFPFPFNSDKLSDLTNIEGPIEQYISVGTGLNWVYNLKKLGYKENTTITFTDINHNCLRFMKAMVDEWDGKDYIDFYFNYIKENIFFPSGFKYNIDDYKEGWVAQWNKFLDNFTNWEETWSSIKKLKFNFVLIDYLGSYDLNWIEPNKTTLINLSDLFNHSPYVSKYSLKYRILCENRLIDTFKKIDKNMFLLMTSRAPDGYHQGERLINSGKVDEYSLTDVNKLLVLPWHEKSWHSPRILL